MFYIILLYEQEINHLNVISLYVWHNIYYLLITLWYYYSKFICWVNTKSFVKVKPQHHESKPCSLQHNILKTEDRACRLIIVMQIVQPAGLEIDTMLWSGKEPGSAQRRMVHITSPFSNTKTAYALTGIGLTYLHNKDEENTCV